MAEVVAAKPRVQSVVLPGGVVLDGAAQFVVPALVAVLCVVSLAMTAARVGDLRYWSDIHEGRGTYQVHSCTPSTGFGSDRWVCEGAMVVDGSTTDIRAELVTSLGAFASHRPFVGQLTQVFFDGDELGTVYPVQYRLNELTRLYLSLLPRLLLFVGSAIWLAGWYLTRGLDASDPVTRDTVRLPGRFAWQPRGLRWIAAAVCIVVINHLLATRIIGSLDTF